MIYNKIIIHDIKITYAAVYTEVAIKSDCSSLSIIHFKKMNKVMINILCCL